MNVQISRPVNQMSARARRRQRQRARQNQQNRIQVIAQPVSGNQANTGGRRRRRNRARRSNNSSRAGLSACAENYLACLEDPWDSHPCCLPTNLPLPSSKVKYHIYGNMQTSATTGMGFVIFNPFFAAFNNTDSVLYTGTTYAATTISGLGPTGVFASNSNSPNASTVAGTNARYRLVSAGLRMRYISTNEGMGGTQVLLEEPSHGNPGGFSYASVRGYDNETSFAITRDWTSVVFHPVDEDETDFYAGGQYPSSNYFLAAIAVAPIATTSITFEFEAVANFELVGGFARSITPSESDPAGFAKVMNVTSVIPRNRMPMQGSRTSRVRQLFDVAKNVGSFLSENRQMIGTVVSGLSDLVL